MTDDRTSDDQGGAEFAHPVTLETPNPVNVVLDPAYRMPGHFDPARAVPEEARPTDAPTDLEALRRIEELVGEFTTEYTALTGAPPEFGPTCDEAALRAAERELGVRLPEDVRALYLLVGPGHADTGLLGLYGLVPLSRVVASRFDRMDTWAAGVDLFGRDRVMLESVPHGRVRTGRRNAAWVVIADDQAGNDLAVDLDPAPGGRSGQVIAYGRDFDGPVGYVADSVSAHLARVVEAFRRGDATWDAEEEYLSITVPDPSGVRYSRSVSVGSADVASLLAGTPSLDTLQRLYLNDADALDLRALAAVPHLRDLRVHRAGTVELWLPGAVQALRLDAREADLSAIAGHPALWDLVLSGHPVRAADLAALPALRHLDLSRAEVDDVTALADLDLRVLTLNPGQWRLLREAGPLPGRLAGVGLDGATRLADAVAWQRWITVT
ncbi:SMI1/KNR4 family protein [Actinosynnema sp. NPDC020468]|uniref:SMI1/KNR4 family protein n=1 Tax=Actinosynnema sp. NPDC020468 TaxID=3154488 RepID=UPI003409F592